jgi:formylglycine-generating enzyme required for sulfatase activity
MYAREYKNMAQKKSVEIFFSYSHQDENLCQELIKHLNILIRQRVIAAWHDRRISPSSLWSDEIDKHLNSCQIILLLVSPDFVSSDYCYDIEMKRALERHNLGEAYVIPIILRPVDWSISPFSHIQSLPKDGKPVTMWGNRDEAFLDIVTGIRSVIDIISSAGISNSNFEEIQNNTGIPYITNVIEKYLAIEQYYTDLPVSIHPQMPPEFHPTLVETLSFQVLIERSFGQEYLAIERFHEDSITAVIDKYPHIVLLGDPGCGKTITIWKLALNYAQKALDEIVSPWPIIVELGKYDAVTPFYDWLFSVVKQIPNYDERLQNGSLVFLLDGLNEMPKLNYSQSIEQLRSFIKRYQECRFIVTCRRLDYDESIGLQQVEVESLSKNNIQKFIANYLKSEQEAEQLFALLKTDDKLLELASNAINLKLIISLYVLVGERFPRNRSQLIDGFVGALYTREKNRSLSETETISESDVRNVLEKIAFLIHSEIGKGTYINTEWALQRLKISSKAIYALNISQNMGLIETTESKMRFQHQLIQEYFAALEMGKRLSDAESRERFWVPKPLEDSNSTQNTLEPIGPPPTTGWEEVTIMLSGTNLDATVLVERIAEYNPILAARCMSEGLAIVQNDVLKRVVNILCEIIENSNNKLNIRIQSGNLIGEFIDPRYKKLELPGGNALLPPMVQIPSGDFFIGSDEDEVSDSYLDEIPRHIVNIEKFSIGEFPTTNAEFSCFITHGGYDKQEYWTDEGWAWRLGKFSEDVKQWLLDGYRNVRYQVLQEEDRLEQSRAEDSDEMDVWWKILMEWSDDRADAELNKLFGERNCHQHNEPCYWNDPNFNGNTQPVITTWFEAQAYCNWLSEITGKFYRLPTEVEWEAATGGSDQKYPWGNEFDTANLNILSTRILTTTPVGIFPRGKSKYGVYDLLGNVWEWSSSAKLTYPYDVDDGRETPVLADSRRVVRGGSWAVSASSARNSCRGNFPPDNLVRNYIGFRVVCVKKPFSV